MAPLMVILSSLENILLDVRFVIYNCRCVISTFR